MVGRSGMTNELRNLLADVFEVRPESISDKDTYETIKNWDSLRHLQMVMAIEQRYNLQVDSEQIPNIKSVADIVQLVERAGQQH